MSDELAARIRALEAERLRPVPPREWHPDPRRTAPPDRIAAAVAEAAPASPGDAAYRREEYAFLRDQGVGVTEAARRVGVAMQTARRYEKRIEANAR